MTDKKEVSKTFITVEDDGKQVSLVVTFDPAPVDKKTAAHSAANIASAMINAFNAKCMFLYQGTIIDKISIPQLEVEYGVKEINYSALHELSEIFKTFFKENIEEVQVKQPQSINTIDEGDTTDAKTTQPKRTLH